MAGILPIWNGNTVRGLHTLRSKGTMMRNEPNLRIENYRIQEPGYESEGGKNYGVFKIGLLYILSSGFADDNNPYAIGWEHVSVRRTDRCPTWTEMDKVKKLFWRDDETVVQFHPREDVKINAHPYCLHLWKLAATEFVLPPSILLG